MSQATESTKKGRSLRDMTEAVKKIMKGTHKILGEVSAFKLSKSTQNYQLKPLILISEVSNRVNQRGMHSSRYDDDSREHYEREMRDSRGSDISKCI